MATGKQGPGGYRPLGPLDKLKLRKAIRALRSPFHSVRVAAHREIAKILGQIRKQAPRDRAKALAKRLAVRGVRRLVPKPLRKLTYSRRHCAACGRNFRNRLQFNAHAFKHQREARERPVRQRTRSGQPVRQRARTQQQRAQQHARDTRAAAGLPPRRTVPAAGPMRGKDLAAANRQRTQPSPVPVARKAAAPARTAPAPAQVPPLPSERVTPPRARVPRAARAGRSRIRIPHLSRSR